LFHSLTIINVVTRTSLTALLYWWADKGLPFYVGDGVLDVPQTGVQRDAAKSSEALCFGAFLSYSDTAILIFLPSLIVELVASAA
jgi:hypothetical protein